MKVLTSYHRPESANTVVGDIIVVTTVYSSFDRSEIDSLESYLQKRFGSGVSSECDWEAVNAILQSSNGPQG